MYASDVIAGIAATAALWALWRTEQTRGSVLRAAWGQSREHRKRFWTVVRRTYVSYLNTKSAEWPRDVSVLIGAAGMPPNVPVRKGAQVRNWYDNNHKFLNAHQKRISEFVVAIYPPRTETTVDVMDTSIVAADTRESFDESRRVLATFFHRQQEELSCRQLFKVAGHTFDDVVLLSWLELALVRGTRDERLGKEGYPGKQGLFEFGRFLTRHRER